MDLVTSVLSGNRLALARLLTLVENDTLEGREALDRLFQHTGNAHLVGVTGAPGTGKSSLVNQIARAYRLSESQDIKNRKRPLKIAIIAVDPTSPFTGGAILGDRVRMKDLAGDPGVFIRSMATRGSLGGLARTTAGMAQVFDAAGYEMVIIETVGAGQSEVDIVRLAHTTLVVEAPGLGDDIQAIKAGILEIADILVINKADRPGVEITERALRSMLDLAHPVAKIIQHHGILETIQANQIIDESGELWIPPILRAIAIEGKGIQQLVEKIEAHYNYLRTSGAWKIREKERLQSELDDLLNYAMKKRWKDTITPEKYSEIVDSVLNRIVSPRQAIEEVIKDVWKY